MKIKQARKEFVKLIKLADLLRLNSVWYDGFDTYHITYLSWRDDKPTKIRVTGRVLDEVLE